ncbi:chain length determinant protein EpsF [Paucibacter sp. KCTC 42545]|uniref:chain length determinant protein EpsF n=1 Tax=Paucibacter sp. KCTC 42545 TaxID=1768242 RepID=UPI000733BB0F|nr:chain length determinant protein EpsF [Paucibacter sp. KCTC 42545]ALT79872.1 chain-length determining protein [Paucibacter sp. KCTC 42545]
MSFAQFLSICLARWKISISIFVGVVALTLFASLLWPKKYLATASVVVEVKPDPLSAMMFSGGPNPSLIATQIDVITSDRVAYKVVRNLKLAENPEVREQWKDDTKGEGSIEQWLGESFQKGLDVRPSRESNVITVGYKAADPRFAAGLANAFVQAYLETTLELKVDPAKQYVGFFENRAKEAREAVEKAQSRLSDYQREKGIIASDERLDVENTRLNELSTQLVGLQALASDSGSRQSASKGAGGERMQEVLGNQLIAGLKADQARMESRLEELNSKLGSNHPQVVELKANMAELNRRIAEETAKVGSSISLANSINQQRVAELKNSLDLQRTKVLQMKAVRDEGSVLLRDVENTQRIYDQIQQRLNQVSLESQANQSSAAVLTQAVPPMQPSSPRLVLNMALSVFVGTLLGVGVALMLELFNRRIRTADDVVQAVGLPIIGVLQAPTAKRLFGRVSAANLAQRRLLGTVPSNNRVA